MKISAFGGRKGIRPVKTEWWDAGMVMCMGQRAYLHMARLMPLALTISCSGKSRLVLPFECRLTWVVPDKIQEGRKMVVCVCVCVCVKIRCFEKSQLVPPGNPMRCHQAAPKAHLNAVQCCKDADFCNRRVPPTLAPPPSTIASGAVLTVSYFCMCVCAGSVCSHTLVTGYISQAP